jgi:dTDP-glucose 4,6-dehydratase
MTHIPETYLGSPEPMDPNSAYGEGKRVGELLCAIAHQETGLEATIARCFAFVGPHLPLDAHFAIGNFIRDAMKGEPLKVKDGTPYRSYLYAADLAVWLWTILFRGGTHGAYNVGSEKEVSILELASLVARIAGANLTVKISQPLIGATKSSRCVPNCQRARRDLNLRENVALPDAINKTVRWLD